MGQQSRIISHHEIKWGGITGIMFSMVVDKFHKRKMFDPCFRVGATINLKICF
jgi:hypothetical protein